MLDLPRDAWTFVHALRAQARELGAAPFLTFSDGSALSFAELDRGSDRVASALARLGLAPGDRMLALAQNSAAFLLALFGALKACVVVTGPPPDPVTLLDWCVERMPRHAVPRFLEFVPALEKTATGKLRKPELRQAGVTSSTWDRESVGYVVRR